jgi:hypothetical protein
MTFTLLFVITYQGTDHGQGIIIKQDPGSFHHLPLLKEPYHLGDIGVDGTPLFSALRVLALKTSVRFIDDMN